MPSRNPRITVVVDPLLYGELKRRAEWIGVSLSRATRNLMREALDMKEDDALAEMAGEREATLCDDTSRSHEQLWG